ncbi:hypothetical protein PATSB16_37070 [Pandoraea thiooxydans]|nr:hypothetical protein PATSB16_37070 [Pandoraea thiooxydans]
MTEGVPGVSTGLEFCAVAVTVKLTVATQSIIGSADIFILGVPVS